jgi:hypothetical protein
MSAATRYFVQGSALAFCGYLFHRFSSSRKAKAHQGALYMGIDSSTQSFKVLVVDGTLKPVAEAVVNFARDLPAYGTTDGFFKAADGMWFPLPL